MPQKKLEEKQDDLSKAKQIKEAAVEKKMSEHQNQNKNKPQQNDPKELHNNNNIHEMLFDLGNRSLAEYCELLKIKTLERM